MNSLELCSTEKKKSVDRFTVPDDLLIAAEDSAHAAFTPPQTNRTF